MTQKAVAQECAEWIRKTTLRDLLKKDNLVLQQNKFKLRAEHEKEAICHDLVRRTDIYTGAV